MSYGLVIRDAGGNITLDSSSTMLRFFGSGHIAPNASGTMPMPGFVSADGFFVPSFKLGKFNDNGGNPSSFAADTKPFEQFGGVSISLQPFELPDLSWNDTSDVLTYTDNPVPDNFGEFTPASAIQQKIYLRFYIFRGGTVALPGDYGLKILNAFGDTILSFEKTLHLKSSGTTKDIILDAGNAGVYTTMPQEPRGLPHISTFSRDPLLNPILQVAAPGYATVWDGHSNRYHPITMDRDDLVFYRLASRGLCYSLTAWCEFPEVNDTGSVALMATDDDGPMEYKIASTNLSGHAPPEDFGLMIKDAAGAVTFDSRIPTVQIVKTQVVSQAQVADIMLNGTHVDITLPYAVPDPWVCCPYLASFRYEQETGAAIGNKRFVRPKITKLNDTTLRVSRHGNRWNSTRYSGAQALWVVVAK